MPIFADPKEQIWYYDQGEPWDADEQCEEFIPEDDQEVIARDELVSEIRELSPDE